MIVRNVNTGAKAGYSVSGTELTIDVPHVGNVTVDVQTRQGDSRRTLDFSLDKDYARVVEGVGPWYVATVVVPAAEKQTADTGQVDGDGNSVIEEVVIPLDMSRVELHLWGLPSTVSKIIKQEGEV